MSGLPGLNGGGAAVAVPTQERLVHVQQWLENSQLFVINFIKSTKG